METINVTQKYDCTILADVFDNFNPQAAHELSAVIPTNQEEIPLLFRNYEYPVSSWPVIIDQQTVTELAELSIHLPRLIRELPKLYFENDVSRLADFYFGGDQMVTQFALMSHQKNLAVSCRLDLTLTAAGFKVLEANIGSSIGGWQVQSFEAVIRELHAPLSLPDSSAQYASRNIQKGYIKFLVDQILLSVDGLQDEINIFINLGKLEEEEVIQQGLTFFDELLSEELQQRGMKGRAVTGDISQIELIKQKLQFAGTELHSVLMLSLDQGEVPPILFRAFLMNKIYFPDHLGTNMYGDKRNLGLLRELAEQNKFSAKDNSLILKAIPWSTSFTTKDVLFERVKHDLGTLLINRQEQFVIKAANGFQGKNVFVGKFLSREEWTEALEIANAEEDFIVQEFCDSLDFLAPNKLRQWTPHKLIWGGFGFGEKFGGTWVRMSEANGGGGVINSATGAVEAIVYEKLSE